MRKMFVILVLIAILLSGCSVAEPEASDTVIQSSIDSVSQTETEDTENVVVASNECAESTTAPNRDDIKSTDAEVSDIQEAESSNKIAEKETLPPQSSGSDNSIVNENTNDSHSSQSVDIPKVTETQTVPTSVRAGKEDSLEVANRVLYYINEFRNDPAIYLPGLAEYAQYRSRQLISNFAHDTADQRAAATTLQYGEYVDPSVFGGSGEPYYSANAREAIAKAGYVGTVDEVAYKLASLVRNSPNHWNYIGSSEYTYIAVGVTYESDMWYCAIEVMLH